MGSAASPSPTAFDRRAVPADAVEARWRAGDGHAIRRIDWPARGTAPRGQLLFLPGRGDTYEKYLETLDYWARAGWRVTASDWRGQALSGRLGLDDSTGHVDDFSIWVDDLATLWGQWTGVAGNGAAGNGADGNGAAGNGAAVAPRVLVAHSMGGHIALRALAEGRIDPDALVLSAPMLGFGPRRAPAVAMHALARGMTLVGDPRRPAWKWSEKPGRLPVDRSMLLTHDEQRYADEAWWRTARPGLAMGPASWGWLERALSSIRALRRPGVLEQVRTPILILATRADRLVDFDAIAAAARRLPNARLVAYGAEARHEILREHDAVRDQALREIDAFLDGVSPADR